MVLIIFCAIPTIFTQKRRRNNEKLPTYMCKKNCVIENRLYYIATT